MVSKFLITTCFWKLIDVFLTYFFRQLWRGVLKYFWRTENEMVPEQKLKIFDINECRLVCALETVRTNRFIPWFLFWPACNAPHLSSIMWLSSVSVVHSFISCLSLHSGCTGSLRVTADLYGSLEAFTSLNQGQWLALVLFMLLFFYSTCSIVTFLVRQRVNLLLPFSLSFFVCLR